MSDQFSSVTSLCTQLYERSGLALKCRWSHQRVNYRPDGKRSLH